MSDLDTDALRELARNDPYSYRGWIEDVQESLREAADTINTLQADVRFRMEAAEQFADERDALRHIIAEAPHEVGCMSDVAGPCDCWKSRIEETR